VSRQIEELAWRETPMGAISLRRRLDPTLGIDVFEVRLGEEYLMSSAFTAAEIALADLGLAPLLDADPSLADVPRLDVVVGGLGLGYTARAVTRHAALAGLVVVEALAEVIRWHVADLLPDTLGLAADPRTRLVEGDFFALAAGESGFDPQAPGRRFDAILLDVDHTPVHVLHPSHAAFYTVDGLARLRRHLRPGGVFALWSDDPPDAGFLDVLGAVFAHTEAHVVSFANPLTGSESANTVYVAR